MLNLGHGVLVGTPEENVAYMFDLSKVSERTKGGAAGGLQAMRLGGSPLSVASRFSPDHTITHSHPHALAYPQHSPVQKLTYKQPAAV